MCLTVGIPKLYPVICHYFQLFLTFAEISALYKDPTKVDNSVQELLRSQHSNPRLFRLRDYEEMPFNELLGTLQKISTSTSSAVSSSYALTTDNLLKMVLIISLCMLCIYFLLRWHLLRIRARIPVVIMGETGCGKTSLIKFLAEVVGSEFAHKDFHAGITEDDIYVATHLTISLIHGIYTTVCAKRNCQSRG